jgi:aminoglycoside phosphotransferase (APT) family kinase protein
VEQEEMTSGESATKGADDPDLGLDLSALQGWIASLGIGVRGDLRFRRVGLGQSNLTIEVRDEGLGRWILRRPPLGELLASAHDIVRETRILGALEGSSVKVPRVVGFCDDKSVSSVPVLLVEHVDGMVVHSMPVAEDLASHMRRQLSDDMVATLAAIHAVDLQASGLADLASHGPYADRQIRRWSGQWERTKTRELPALEELTAVLRGSVPAQHETVLVHGDFHLRNVIASPDSGQVRAVLDWELATLGDPIADLGSMLAYWPQHNDIPTSLFAASALPGFRSRDELTAAYLSATGRDGSAVTFWHALGLWKIAIICEGVLRRALEVPSNAAAGGPPDRALVEQMVERAFSTVGDGP